MFCIAMLDRATLLSNKFRLIMTSSDCSSTFDLNIGQDAQRASLFSLLPVGELAR